MGYGTYGSPLVAGILTIDGLLVDPVNEDIGGGVTLTAPANSISLSASAVGITANAVTPLGGGAFMFDQADLDLDLSDVITLSDGVDSAPIDLASVGTLTGQVIDDAVLTFAGGGSTELAAPIDVTFNLPLGDSGFLHVHVTGTIHSVSTGAVGDYNNSGQVEQGDLDLVLQNWGVNTDTAGVPSGWVNDPPSGQIEQTELDGVLQNWGDTAAPDLSGSSLPGVPEPGGAATLALLAGGAASARRRAG